MNGEKQQGQGSGLVKTRLVLAFMALLPVLVMTGWFLACRDEAGRREGEDARQILGMALDRVETSIAPMAPLESIVSEEMSNHPSTDPVIFESILRSALKQMIPSAHDPLVVRMNLFDMAAAPLLWPPDENPGTAGTIWRGLEECFRQDFTGNAASSDPVLLASGSKALFEWFGSRVSLEDLVSSGYFGAIIPDKNNRPQAVAAFRNVFGRMKDSEGIGVIIRIPLDAIPPASYHRWAAISRPSDEDAAGLGILDQTGRNWLVRSGRLPEALPREVLEQPDRVRPVPDGFAVVRDLPPHAAGRLVLFRPESFWTGRGAGFRFALTILILIAAIASWLLSGILTGAGFGSLRMRTAMVFLLAGMVPIGFSVLQGSMRLLNLEAARQVEWEAEAGNVMKALDREFRDILERYQYRFNLLMHEIAGNPGKNIKDAVFSVASCTEAINIEAGDPARGSHPDDTVRTSGAADEQGLLIRSPIIEKILKNIFSEMRAATGDGVTPDGFSTKEKFSLPLHEMIGDAVPFRELFNQMGHVTYAILSNKIALLFCNTYSLRNERIAGLMIGGTTLGNDSLMYFNAYVDSDRGKRRDWDLYRINRSMVDPKLPTVPREFLRLSVRTQQTGSPAKSRIEFHDGPHLVLTSRPSYLQLGTLAARTPVGRLRMETAWLLVLACAGVLLAFGLVAGVAVYLAKRLLEPIQVLQKAAESVGEGSLDICIDIHGKDELAALGASFLQMTDGLRQRKRMRRFLSESAWAGTKSAIAADVEKSGYRDVAVLCSDIRGFTSLSEKQAPAVMTAMLNEYFTAMDGVIRSFGGEIDKLIGDAIQAVFKFNAGSEHPAKRAVLAGLAMRKKLAAMNSIRVGRGEFVVENGIGIHFGRVICGKVGAAGGRQDFTVIGSAVTIAARLEAASRSGRHTKVVISEQTTGLIGPDFVSEPLITDDFRDGQACEIVDDRRIGYTGAAP